MVKIYLLGLFYLLLFSQNTNAFNGFDQEIERYITETANTYNVSESMLRGLIKMEDGWNGKISPTGAVGVGQFTVKTWNFLAQTKEGHDIGMQLVTSENRNKPHDPRRNKRINTLAIGLLAQFHLKKFAERKIQQTDENLYIAHNIGLDGLYRALHGKSTKEDIRNMRLNGMKKKMSVNDFLTFQKQRYNKNKLIANAQSTIWIQPNINIVWIIP
ncbi:lytic transglycosylase domain-containing protein [Pasteurella oralis]|uniref:lytic transglycosylase domain-containing protein n=1 Tax=Pasteurella oralis TaxID=1071947 RepID=UPI000C7B5469|nr:lytic transglycosylase domain-containing protein [Pasteurella oralis]